MKALAVSQKQLSWLIPVIACLSLVIILWLPFGLKVSGIMEEWLTIHDLEEGGLSDRNEDYALFITTGIHRLRPLVGVPHILAYSLTPDSFVGYNLVAMTLFVGKGIVLYLILRKLAPGNKPYALLVALLFVIYPADGGLFTFRALSIHLSVLWFLLSIYLFLIYFQSGRRWALVAAWTASIGHLWIYEVAYPLVAAIPLLLIWVEGQLNRRVIRASLLWFLAPLVALLYEIVMFTQGESYQSWLLQRSGLSQPAVLGEMLTSMYNAYYRHFIGGWLESLSQIGTPFLWLALICGVGMVVAGRLLGRQKASQSPRYWGLAVMGAAIVGLGYVAFLVTPYRQLDWRVYYYSSIGGAICIGSLIYLFIRYTRLPSGVFVGLMGTLIGLATLHGLNQHAYYAGLALSQQELLHGVVQQVPKVSGNATLVVVDETGRYFNNWSLGASYLVRYALQYVYSDYDLNAILCSFDPNNGQFIILPEQLEQCDFTPEGVALKQDGIQVGSFPYDRIVIVRYSDDGAALLDALPQRYLTLGAEQVYNPSVFVDAAASPPRRFYTMFSLPG